MYRKYNNKKWGNQLKASKTCKVTSLFTAILIILSSFTFLQSTARIVSASTVLTDTFRISLISGAAKSGTQNVWNATSEAAGHQFVYRIIYAFKGNGQLDPGAIEIRIPAHIMKNRNNKYSDICEAAIPSESEAVSSSDFAYTLDDDELIIRNHKQISAADQGFIDIAYTLQEKTFYYTDMNSSDIVYADLSILDGTEIAENKHTTADSVVINTTAKLYSTEKGEPEDVIANWNNNWGTKPEDADLYYYLIWPVVSRVEATQPYTVTLEDDFNEPDTEVVGYKLQGDSQFSDNNTSSIHYNSGGLRTDYVLTRHLKSTYHTEQYNLRNRVVTTVTPADGIDAPDFAESSIVYRYDKPIFVYPTDGFNSWKYGNTTWHLHPGFPEWPVADYDLQDFKEGKKEEIPASKLYYMVYVIGHPYGLTLPEGADPDNYQNYGKRKVTYTVTDETFYLNDNITTDHEVMTIPEDLVPMTSDDYEIVGLNFYLFIKDAKYNAKKRRFDMVKGTYTPEDIMYIDGKFGDSAEWIENIAWYNLATKETYINEEYVNTIYINDNDQIHHNYIKINPNCTAYRVRTSNAHIQSVVQLYPHIKLKRSQNVLDSIYNNPLGENKAWVTNVAHTRVTDENGNTCFYKDINGRDYLYGFVPESYIRQQVTTFKNDKVEKKATIGWKTEMSETFMTNNGLEYVLQNGGTFYSLLPLGSDIDKRTIAVRTDKGFLDISGYDVSTIVNYNGTGRTMLKVKLKEPFNTAELTYSTIYSWESVIDYGGNLLISTAYETENEDIADGYPDNGGKISETALMKNLDPETDDEKFIYTQAGYHVDVLLAANTGLTKTVKNTTSDNVYSVDTKVKQNSAYLYKLRYASDSESETKNIILYDNIERHLNSASNLHSDWQGSLEFVDVSQIRRSGAEPVVYYTSSDIDLKNEANKDLEVEIAGERIWYTEEEFIERYGSISQAAAVAIDIRKTPSGSDFILGKNSSVVALLYMRAPAWADDETDMKAYNEVYISDTIINSLGEEIDYYIYQGNTTARFRIMNDILLHKTSSEDYTVPAKGVTFNIQGTSYYGTEVDITGKTDENGRLIFSDIERGEYILTETEGTDDFFALKEPLHVEIDKYGGITVDGEPVMEGIYYDLEDEPRLHADVTFFKKDYVDHTKYISGAAFELSGKSDYDNEIVFYSTSDDEGIVTFKNIEKGTYQLKEYKTDRDHLLSTTVWKVTVLDNDLYTIGVDGQEGDGDNTMVETESTGTISVYNEPYHSFTIQKEGTVMHQQIEGAVFRLSGVSDGGTAVRQERTTNARGQATFTNLEAGTYVLEEISVPEGYILDERKRIVKLDKKGNVNISDTGVDNGRPVITNDESSYVIITKKWVDNETNESREEQGIAPEMHITTNPFKSEAYFGTEKATAIYGIGTSWRSEFTSYSVLQRIKPLHELNSFQPYEGDDAQVRTLIENGKAKKLDDGTTPYSIYGWEVNGAVYWWTDAKTVYLTNTNKDIFYEADWLTKIDLRGINTSKMTDMSYFFCECTRLVDLDITEMDTSNVTNMAGMFCYCTKLQPRYFSVKNFNTSKVTNMSQMFYALARDDDKNYTLSTDTSDTAMSVWDLDLTSFDTSNVTNMREMFWWMRGKCHKIDLSSFDTSKVTDMYNMFWNSAYLRRILVSEKWNVDNVTNSTNMFTRCPRLAGSNGTATGGWNPAISDKRRACIDDPANGRPGYLTYKAAPEIVTPDPDDGQDEDDQSEDGIHFSSNDSNCTIEKLDDKTWQYTFTGLDPTMTFYGWESELEGYTSPNMGENNFIELVNRKGTITNTTTDNPPPPPSPEFASLTVHKIINAANGALLSEDDIARTFLFTLTLTDENDQGLEGTVIYGDAVFINGVSRFRLAGGNSAVFEMLPVGYHYRITEEPLQGFETSYQNEEGILVSDSAVEVSVTNTKLNSDDTTVDFTLSKQVDGNAQYKDEEYSFIISFEGLYANKSYNVTGDKQDSFRSSANGSAVYTILLKDSESVRFNGIPVGANYRITEIANMCSAAYQITNSGTSGSIAKSRDNTSGKTNRSLSTHKEMAEAGENISVVFTNTKTVYQDIKLRKEVRNVSQDNSDVFTFTVVLRGLDENAEIYTSGIGKLIAVNGMIEESFTMTAQEELIFYDLPVGTQYSFIEQASPYIASYAINNHGSNTNIVQSAGENNLPNQVLSTVEETVDEGEEVEVVFTNTKQQHDITISKIVDMTYGNLSFAEYSAQKFEFVITLEGLEPETEYQAQLVRKDITGVLKTEKIKSGVNGTVVFETELCHNESLKILDLPANALYAVKEKECEFYIAEYAITGNDGAIISRTSDSNRNTKTALSTQNETVDLEDRDIHITFTNRFNASDYVLPSAGFEDKRLIMVILLTGAVLFGIILIFQCGTRRKQNKS